MLVKLRKYEAEELQDFLNFVSRSPKKELIVRSEVEGKIITVANRIKELQTTSGVNMEDILTKLEEENND